MKKMIVIWFSMYSTLLMAADMQSSQSLITDCYQEWQSRGWTLGEDRRPASTIIGFREGIMRICEVRTELFLQGADVSPYIQGRLRDLAPYVFTATKEDIKQRILQVNDQTGYPAGSDYLSE
ncbi:MULTISPECIES: hypothetical protein [unclassified Methylophaga]|uniref:hypothetical protein n=1 Tax=unclassified Methylophaga TaxID=2629249 RepID=UPI000C897465|nr:MULTISPECIES: hypothetical protein [unclassified Methylophaga]MBN47245.1 hypothetical protein [Methylophaga sp.]|tara:strand:- start:41720 stop:42085 length:366 start_codon:yes stop_codon:yes gene_type:complete